MSYIRRCVAVCGTRWSAVLLGRRHCNYKKQNKNSKQKKYWRLHHHWTAELTFPPATNWCTIESVSAESANSSPHSSFGLANRDDCAAPWWCHRCIRRWSATPLGIRAIHLRVPYLWVYAETAAWFGVWLQTVHKNFRGFPNQFARVWWGPDPVLPANNFDSRCNAQTLMVGPERKWYIITWYDSIDGSKRLTLN